MLPKAGINTGIPVFINTLILICTLKYSNENMRRFQNSFKKSNALSFLNFAIAAQTF